MAALPLMISLGYGLVAGAHQFIYTRRMLRGLEWLPRAAWPSAVHTVVERLGIRDRIDIVHDPAPETFCFGLLRPRICVTTGVLSMLTDDELEAVLCHERHHLQQRDPLRILLWTVVDAACWRTGADGAITHVRRELAADRAVIATGQRESLARALFKLLTHPARNPDPSLAFAVSRLSATQARIDQLIGADALPPKEQTVWHSRWYSVPAVLAGVPLLCLVMLSAR